MTTEHKTGLRALFSNLLDEMNGLFQTEDDETLKNKFVEHFGDPSIDSPLAKFTSSPFMHGEFEAGVQNEGYFAGQPYTAAAAMYFIRSALYPEKKEKNYKAFIQDLDDYNDKEFHKDVNGETDRNLKLYYPMRSYLESIIEPFLNDMDIDVKNKQATPPHISSGEPE